MSQVYNPEAFGRALKGLAEGDDTPYVHLAKAYRHMQDTEMHALAFGVLGMLMVKGDYDKSREFISDQLNKGTKNMRAVLAGLNQVAANNRGAEQANLIEPQDIEIPDARATDSNVENYVEGAALYSSKVGLLAMLTGTTSKQATSLARTAGVAAALWLTYMPDDAEISKSHSQWTHAARELDAFDDSINQKTKALNDSWRGKASDTFTSYIDGFKNEVSECAEAIRSGAATMQRSQLVLSIAQHVAFVHTLANLIALAILEIFKKNPATFATSTAAQIILGGMLSVNTAGWFSKFGAAISELGLAVFGLSRFSFVTEKERDGSSAASNGVDFDEVSLSQEEIARIESDAGGN